VRLMLPLDMAVRLLSDPVRLNSRTNCVRLSISQNGVAQLRRCMRCISSGITLLNSHLRQRARGSKQYLIEGRQLTGIPVPFWCASRPVQAASSVAQSLRPSRLGAHQPFYRRGNRSSCERALILELDPCASQSDVIELRSIHPKLKLHSTPPQTTGSLPVVRHSATTKDHRGAITQTGYLSQSALLTS
jgi:hypothetical protein